MKLPLQISFRHMDRSEAIEELAREKSEKLDRLAGDIMSCRVVIEPAGKHHEFGNQYQVRIDLTLAGGEIAVTHEPSEHVEYREIGIALRDAFETAQRRIEEFVRLRRQDVKTHKVPPHGRVTQIFPPLDYGFIKSSDGRDIYFHRHSVLHEGFDRLQVGSEVTFVEESGIKGPQASTVRLMGRHHHV